MLSITILLFLINFSEKENSVVKWQERPEVAWSDFHGAPDFNSPFDAQVYSGMQYSLSYSISNGQAQFTYDVHSFFNPAKSWSKKERRSAYLLKHEQIHFDISELYARKLRIALDNFDYAAAKNPKHEIEKIFNQLNKERKGLQLKYDHETDHSKNKVKQTEWENYIRVQLSLHQ